MILSNFEDVIKMSWYVTSIDFRNVLINKIF